MAEEYMLQRAVRLLGDLIDRRDGKLASAIVEALHEGISSTLLDRRAISLPSIVENYMNIVSAVADTAAAALKLLGFSSEKANAYRGLASALYFGSTNCAPVIFEASVELEGRLYRRGDYTCLETIKALGLVELGFARLVETGLKEAREQ
ncbi:hypothetical protein [Hyperthermus butylicus]|uniref:Uncharacterized protein n=1 Tax=Hyperthermus butylicus (strain DSM 5456 / JCM 9403 / PLM1-5) TaxID=415426 RepID=A2BN96_HYPBU|nr:hypothetical protein [Hyperthermus butylicus]ABM81457.1 hypothetical protein Hbut_1643 [Hyperthermus butylicus DSM 5456]